MRLHVMTGDFQNSLKIIEPITFDALSVFSKAVPSYISLFYYTGFSYLMNKQYKEAFIVLNQIIMLVKRIKQFISKSKSMQYQNMTKEFDKCINLLALVLQFYPAHVDEQIEKLFDEVYALKKDKKETVTDKIKKMKKYETQIINEILLYASPKICVPIREGMDVYKPNSELKLFDVKE